MKRVIAILLSALLALATAAGQPRDTLRILAIGNSFSEDSVEQYLWELFDAAGIPVIIGNMYIGGCTLERHFKNTVTDKKDYAYRKVVDGVKTETPKVNISYGLKDEPWDYVSFQQASGVSGEYETYEPYLQALAAYVRRRVPATATFMWHQTWAYSTDAGHREFPRYERDQLKMYHSIMAASRQAAGARAFPILIPSGTAIQNARTSSLGDALNRDGFHLEKTYGRYTASCTWFEAISGISVVGNAYHPDSISDETAAICQAAAHNACLRPFTVTSTGPAPAARESVPDPEAHVLLPVSGNIKTRIAVFGGSLSVKPESDAAKQIWADALDAEVTTYGVGGAGFAISRGYSIQKQVDEAGVYDIYVLWASTNDFVGDEKCGTWKDYTEADGYNTSKLDTQCGGINYCIRRLREKNPEARIYFFTSLRFFRRDAGYNPFSTDVNKTKKNFAQYVDAQIACCRYQGVPVLDQFSLQDVGIDNYQPFYLEDKLHMTEEGYRRIAPLQASFLAAGR